MVAVVVKKSASPKESSDGLVEYVLEDAWGKIWTFRAESSSFIPDQRPSKDKAKPEGSGFLKCRRLCDYRKQDGKSIIAVKTEIESTDGISLFEIKWDDIWGDGSHNEGSEILKPISPVKFNDIGVSHDHLRDVYLKLRILPRFLVYQCECGPIKVSSLAMYVECPKCGFDDKIRHLGAGIEVQDVLLIAAAWLGIKDESTMHSLKLHPDDLGKEVDWSEWDRYFKVTTEELQKVSDKYAIQDDA